MVVLLSITLGKTKTKNLMKKHVLVSLLIIQSVSIQLFSQMHYVKGDNFQTKMLEENINKTREYYSDSKKEIKEGYYRSSRDNRIIKVHKPEKNAFWSETEWITDYEYFKYHESIKDVADINSESLGIKKWLQYYDGNCYVPLVKGGQFGVIYAEDNMFYFFEKYHGSAVEKAEYIGPL
jgi:hypothetical protein